MVSANKGDGSDRMSAMVKFGTDAVTPEHDSKSVLWYDLCLASPGSVPTAHLPAQVQTQLTQPLGSQLTFVFEGKVAGIRGSILWDSGAARSFTSCHFVRLHPLGTSQSTTQVQVADGSVVDVVTYAHYACVADCADAMADAWEDTAGCAQAICLHENLLE